MNEIKGTKIQERGCKREKIEETLKKFDFVNWDRYFTCNCGLSVFGWIEREDEYKDFVILDFIGEEITFATSSKKYSEKIAGLLNQEHSDCQRVEDFLDIDNVVKLNKEKNGKRN